VSDGNGGIWKVKNDGLKLCSGKVGCVVAMVGGVVNVLETTPEN